MTRTPKTPAGRLPGALAALTAALALSACGGGDALQSPSSGDEGTRSTVASSTTTTTTTTTIAQPANTEGRLLASNCFQCHGTLGLGGFDQIRGDESKELLEFATKTADRDIMAAHAQGYTPEQLRKVIAYLQQ